MSDDALRLPWLLAAPLLVALMALTACASGSDPRGPSATGAGGGPIAPSAEASSTSVPTSDTAPAQEAVRALSAAGTVRVQELANVLSRLPPQLQGRPGTRTDSGISYPLQAGPATLEAMERADVYGPTASAADRTAQGLIDRLVRDQRIEVVARCDDARVLCVAGGSAQDRAVAVWLSPDSDLVFAAVGGTMTDVRALAEAWRVATQ